tara:strand:+ start:153 stop:338 length:186 start_codon:yes stop_codon:yes gene_type:complete
MVVKETKQNKKEREKKKSVMSINVLKIKEQIKPTIITVAQVLQSSSVLDPYNREDFPVTHS